MRTRYFAFLVTFLISFGNLYATDMLVKSVSRPFISEFVNKPFKPSFVIRNDSTFKAFASEWVVYVNIRFNSETAIFSSTVQGQDLDPNTEITMTTTPEFTPTEAGNYTIDVQVSYEQEVDPSNDKLTASFTVYDTPLGIMEISPPDDAILIPPGQVIMWTNGETPFSQTDVFLTQGMTPIDWDSTPDFSSTDPAASSFIPGDDLLPGTMYNWGVRQTNGAGSTINGPFSFTTLQTPSQIQNIIPSDSGSSVPLDQILMWENGDTPFIKTEVFLTEAPEQIDFNAIAVAESDDSSFNSYTKPGGFMYGKTYNWGIKQTNEAGTTTNGPFSFTTEDSSQDNGLQIMTNEGIEFSQIDFTFENFQQQNSPLGIMYADFDRLAEVTGMTFGFINAFSPDLGWFVQNMIFDASLEIDSENNGLSTLFSLEDLQTSENEIISGIEAHVSFTEIPVLELTAGSAIEFNVGKTEFNAQGKDEPVGNIATPIDFNKLPFKENGKDDLVWQHGHVNIEQATNQCGPASVANSFQWLENKQGIQFPHEHKPGIRDTTLVGQLDIAADRQLHKGVSDNNMLKGKVKYISDNNLQNKLVIKHKSRNDYKFLSKDTVKSGNAMSIPNTDTTLSMVDWIISELKHGEDVELSLSWNGGGGHYVDLIGGGYVNGVPWLAWAHDANQGVDDKGTADKTDDTVKLNGGITPKTSGFMYSYIVDNKISFAYQNGSKSIGIIDCALSESKDSTGTTSIGSTENILPEGYNLYQNYPNPFNPSTRIRFEVPEVSIVKIAIYDALGKEVKVLVNKEFSAGTHILNVNLENFASGVYYYTMISQSYKQTRKLILLK